MEGKSTVVWVGEHLFAGVGSGFTVMGMQHDTATVHETVRQAILDRRSLNAVYDTCIRYFSPHILGKDSEGNDCVLVFQYAGKYPGGLPIGGRWCCFKVKGLHWLRANGDKWLTGPVDGMPVDCIHHIECRAEPPQ